MGTQAGVGADGRTDEWIEAEAFVERLQVQVDPRRGAHALDAPLRHVPGVGLSAEQDAVGAELRHADDDRLVTAVKQTVQDPAADARDAVKARAARQPEGPARANLPAHLEGVAGCHSPGFGEQVNVDQEAARADDRQRVERPARTAAPGDLARRVAAHQRQCGGAGDEPGGDSGGGLHGGQRHRRVRLDGAHLGQHGHALYGLLGGDRSAEVFHDVGVDDLRGPVLRGLVAGHRRHMVTAYAVRIKAASHLVERQRPAVRITFGQMSTSIDVFAKAREHERIAQLKAARDLGALPYFHTLEGPTLPVVMMEGHSRIMLGSNNYLGLTGDERVKQGAMDALNRYGTGITGSRFLNGTLDLHLELERELAEWLGTDAALVFTTGHQANVGALGTILGPGDTVVADSGDHASILDGVTISKAKLRAFRHNRLDQLERRLERAVEDGGGILVVVDGVFSTEGDVAPLPEICDLCARYGARLMVDEAHALGVLGARGAGTCELLGVEDRVDLRMATFSKSLASCGGVIAGPADVVEFLRIQARSFIFTASGVPAAVGAALAAVRVCRSEEGRALFARVLDNAAYLHRGLRSSASTSCRPRACPTGPRSSRRSSRSWSATTGRPSSSGRPSTRPAFSST